MAGEGRVTSGNRGMRGLVAARLRGDYERLGTWRAVAAAWGISPALAWRVAMDGYWPRDAALRRRLLTRAGVWVSRRRDLFSLSVDELRRRLEHREEVTCDDETAA